jgi:hypothetical protein
VLLVASRPPERGRHIRQLVQPLLISKTFVSHVDPQHLPGLNSQPSAGSAPVTKGIAITTDSIIVTSDGGRVERRLCAFSSTPTGRHQQQTITKSRPLNGTHSTARLSRTPPCAAGGLAALDNDSGPTWSSTAW